MSKLIKFFTNNDTLLQFPELHPQPARNFIPQWFKDLPIKHKAPGHPNPKLINTGRTVKTCPSFAEIFNEGFVLVAPCDIWLRVEKDGDWEWAVAYNDFHFEMHEDTQMVNHLPNKNIRKIFKLISPWYAITPKGYSVRQFPMMYDYENTDWHIPYGVIKTDQHYFINQQICVTTDKTEIYIKKGDPLNYLVPYKRENFKMKIEPFEKHKKELDRQHMLFGSTFRSGYHKHSN